MPFVVASKEFVVGIPKVAPRVPQGWKLRTSQFDFPAAIDPGGVEWIIAVDGALHEIQQVTSGRDIFRKLTGRTRPAEPESSNSESGSGSL